MKVGMIFECGPKGADKPVCERLARMLQKDITISSVTLTNKPNLVSECGNVAAELLKDGCERIIIIWDLYPAWRDKKLKKLKKLKEKPCLKEDRAAILESLAQAGVVSPQVYLVCIHAELEAWLLADGNAISLFLSKPTDRVTIKDTKKPERIPNPKDHLNKIFETHNRSAYIDANHAEEIVKNINLKKLKRCPSFVRFAEKLTGVTFET